MRKKVLTRIDIVFLGGNFSIQKIEEMSTWIHRDWFLNDYSLAFEEGFFEHNIIPRSMFQLTLSSIWKKERFFFYGGFEREFLNGFIRDIQNYTGSKMIENTVEDFKCSSRVL